MKSKVCKIFALALCVATVLTLGALNCSAAVLTDGTDYYIAGDANGDGEFDIRDLVCLKKLSLGAETETSPAADFDGDGTANSADLAVARKMLLDADNSNWSAIYK